MWGAYQRDEVEWISTSSQFGPNANHSLSFAPTMSLVAGVRKAFLFVFVFGVLAPRALAAFAVCQAGWEWVSDRFGFPLPDIPGSRV